MSFNDGMANNSSDYKIKKCRACGNKKLHTFLSLGSMPIPNGFIKKQNIEKPEKKYPLKACLCLECYLVQLTHIIPPQIMFKNYLYVPSASNTMVSHFKKLADKLLKKLKPKFVVDIGSNDGTLLSNFQNKGIKVLGVDPAENIAKEANKRGINTYNGYFDKATTKHILNLYGKADIVTATNVVAHIDDLKGLFANVKLILCESGIFVIEAPYILDLIENNEFDTIYHEHLSYLSIHPLRKLLKKSNLKIIDIEKQQIHGGSMRIYIAHSRSKYKAQTNLNKILQLERVSNLQSISYYDDFACRVKSIKANLTNLLSKLKKEGKIIVGYGASAKGNVLLNYCKITSDTLDYIVDSTPYKQGKYTPGTHIPIYPEDKLMQNNPDYVLILSWNFIDEIIGKNKEYIKRGGKFIVTIPYLRIF